MLKDQHRILFMRTNRFFEFGDFKMIYFLSLFGLKSILKNELEITKIMKTQMQENPEVAETFEKNF